MAESATQDIRRECNRRDQETECKCGRGEGNRRVKGGDRTMKMEKEKKESKKEVRE